MEKLSIIRDGLESQMAEPQKLQKINIKSPQKEICLALDNTEFCRKLRISRRTAQSWRDQGKISFSQIGAKIYYQISDVQEFLNKNKICSII